MYDNTRTQFTHKHARMADDRDAMHKIENENAKTNCRKIKSEIKLKWTDDDDKIHGSLHSTPCTNKYNVNIFVAAQLFSSALCWTPAKRLHETVQRDKARAREGERKMIIIINEWKWMNEKKTKTKQITGRGVERTWDAHQIHRLFYRYISMCVLCVCLCMPRTETEPKWMYQLRLRPI